jgi:peptidoglycan hydrolase-like protein with peptidoglycan-binding domain
MKALTVIAATLVVQSLLAPGAGASKSLEVLQVAVRGDAPEAVRHDNRPDPLVRRIQTQLVKIGIYQGPVDGIMGPRTEQAIRMFQKSRGMPVTGKASEELAHTLETDEKVDQLLHRLEAVRDKKVEAARQALLADPRTRHLLEEKTRDEVADPTRDAAPCFAQPTPRCLLVEAVESAKAVFKDELRDWAWGEILAAQARAGLAEAAMVTARRISDPRLIVVALREIAEALADAGETDAALAAVDIIPDAAKRLEAFGTIAEIQAGLAANGHFASIVERAEALLRGAGDAVDTVKYLTRFALLYDSLGRPESARRYMREAERAADTLRDPAKKSAALRHVAIARAEMADPDGARRLIDDTVSGSDRTPVLTSVATAHARNGAADKALATAQEIEAGRYRAVALSSVASMLAHGGDPDHAASALDEARAVAGEIKLPYARSFAASRVAMALLDMATASGTGFTDVLRAADAIEDETLRAYTLWAVATEQRRAGDREAAESTEVIAREAVDTIKSRLSRVWLYGDLVRSFAEAGETEPAWRAFNDGLAIARDINNAWGRARSLAKLADALTVLTDPALRRVKRARVKIPDRPAPYAAPKNGGDNPARKE